MRLLFQQRDRFHRFERWYRPPEALAAIAGLMLLAADVGLDEGALFSSSVLIAIQATLALILLLRVPVAMVLERNIKRGFFHCPIDAVLLGMAILGFVALPFAPDSASELTNGVRLTLLGAIIVYTFNVLRAFQRLSISPLALFAGAYAIVILIGAGCLMLPKATRPDYSLSFIDALFTSTSASCVTGLNIIPDVGNDLTRLGHTVLIVLMQVGGLGIMTFAAFAAIAAGAGMSIRDRVAMGEVLNYDVVGRVGRLVFWILGITIVCEGIGVWLLFGHWVDQSGTPLGFGDQLYWSVFHSVSAFCNAGFGMHPDSLISYVGDWPVMLTIGWLIILGGLGFTVMMDALTFKPWRTPTARRLPIIGKYLRRNPLPRLTLHTKIVLTVTVILIVIGTVGFYCMEINNPKTLGREDLSTGEQWINAWFQGGVTPRTAGFNSLDYASMGSAALFFTIILMFIGASPGSTAGGLKTTSVAVLWLSLWATFRRRPVEAFKRRLVDDQIQRVLVLLVVALIVINAAVFTLLCTEPHIAATGNGFLKLTFEVVSAFATVGLSTGITAELSEAGRIVIVICMFLGRLGPLTLVLAIGPKHSTRFDYPKEAVMLG